MHINQGIPVTCTISLSLSLSLPLPPLSLMRVICLSETYVCIATQGKEVGTTGFHSFCRALGKRANTLGKSFAERNSRQRTADK
jgi:hypothetical protein